MSGGDSSNESYSHWLVERLLRIISKAVQSGMSLPCCLFC